MNSLVLAGSAVLFACAAFALPTAAQAPADLDGKVFVVDLGPKGKPADEKDDVLTFRDGRFHSRFCDRYGYGTGAYEASSTGGAVAFTAQTVSDADGRLVWSGRVEGSAIEGRIVHHRQPGLFNRNPTPRELWFKGRVRD